MWVLQSAAAAGGCDGVEPWTGGKGEGGSKGKRGKITEHLIT